MALLRKGGVLALAAVMFAGPAIACVTPVAAMVAEMCCRPQPMTHCGAMPLPSAKSCCSAPATPQQTSLATPASTARSHLPVVAQVAQPVAHGLACQAARFLGVGSESPPESPPGSVSILRI
jgi:hypothetical protein